MCKESLIENEKGNWKIHEQLTNQLFEYRKIELLSHQSSFLSLYAIVESGLDVYYKMCKDHFQLTLDIEDLKDRGIVAKHIINMLIFN